MFTACFSRYFFFWLRFSFRFFIWDLFFINWIFSEFLFIFFVIDTVYFMQTTKCWVIISWEFHSTFRFNQSHSFDHRNSFVIYFFSFKHRHKFKEKYFSWFLSVFSSFVSRTFLSNCRSSRWHEHISNEQYRCYNMLSRTKHIVIINDPNDSERFYTTLFSLLTFLFTTTYKEHVTLYKLFSFSGSMFLNRFILN